MKKYLRYLYLLLIFLFVFSQLFAQEKITVKGIVTSAEDGRPIPGASVAVKGTTTGISTDAKGNYQLSNVAGNSMLVFSYLGYKSQEIPVNNRSKIDVALELSTQSLEQVVVVGYGTTKKKDLTGSIANVKGEELAKQPVQTPTQAMQGKVAGVQIISSGEPNSQPKVRVRGTGSTLAGVEPLYVVDGVLTDDIRNINNADIASMDVLKDASAAIYGVRAANGVIIITTKKGEVGKTVVRYDGNAGFREAANLVEMANRSQYVSYLNDVAPGKVAADDAPPLTFDGTNNWYDDVLGKAFQMNHNISVSGGTEKYKYYFSSGYINEDGIITTNSFNRFNFRANNEVIISPKFKLGSQLSYTRSENRAVELGDTYRNVYRAAPIVPSKIGTQYGNTSAWGNVGNPLLSIDKRNQHILNDRVQGNLGLDYFILKELKFRTAFNADLFFINNRTYSYQFNADETTFLVAGGNQRVDNSRLNLREDDSFRWTFDNTLTYEKTFGDHNLTVLAGLVTEQGDSTYVLGERINVPADPAQWYLRLGDPNNQSINDNGGSKYARQSFVGRVAYNYLSKYLVSASFRADGSSKFKEKWGYFPTVGLGWVLTAEDFMKNQKIFDYLKLRSSWGILGNDGVPPDAYISLLQTNVPYFFNNAIVLGSTIPQIKDPNIKWEKTTEFDFGLDFTMFKDRLSGELDYYRKKVEDALTYITIPGLFGDADNQYLTNVASFRNEGFEFALRWENPVNEKLSYHVGFNMTFNNNKVTGLAGGQAIFAGGVGGQGFVTKTDVGQPVGSFYILKSLGVFQSQEEINAYVGQNGTPIQPNAAPGDLKYEDFNGDGIIDINGDRQFFGSYQPKSYYGINFGINYKNFDLSADFYGNTGNKIYNGKKAFRFETTDNIEANYANARWTTSHPSTTDPRLIVNSTPASTYFLESGSFFRMNNLTIGYTIPASAFGKSGISRLRFYLTSQNLFTIKDFSGFSPELPGGPLDSGIELNAYPTTRTFAFGVNLSL